MANGPNTIMIIRHGEKPGEGSAPHGVNVNGEHDEHALAVRGWMRAGALAGMMAHSPSPAHPTLVRPGRVYATAPSVQEKSRRELDTAKPTADRLSLVVESGHGHGEEKNLADAVLGQSADSLIVWHHGSIPKLLGHFPVINAGDVPHDWPADRFDVVWVLTREQGVGGGYRFSTVDQALLAGDKSPEPA